MGFGTNMTMTALEELVEKEKIKELKVIYVHLLDTVNIDELVGLFTDDAICEFGPEYGMWEGKETIEKNYRNVYAEFGHFETMHHVTNHYIELLSSTKARGRSYLIDALTDTPAEKQPITWLGVYDEEYRKEQGKWLISKSSLQFLWPKRMVMDDFKSRDISLT